MKILVRDERGIRELDEGFASEVELQRFLKEHADLMPLEDIDLAAPPLLCIGWEVGVVSGAEDILYVDSSGLLTVVETKLRRNPESRREVVGQILEYAAQMSSWDSSEIERQAEAFFRSEHSPDALRGSSLRQAMESHVSAKRDDEFDYDQFQDDVQEHIDGGHFRLVIAIDEAPEPLLKTVEFVNRFSRHFEIYLAQLKRFTDSVSNADIFVPAIFGRVASAKPGRRSPGRRWDRDQFFDAVRSTGDEELVRYVTRVYEEFEDWTEEVLFGSGKNGSFNLVVFSGETRANMAGITTNGELWIHFEWMTDRLPQPTVDALRDDLNAIPGISLPRDVYRKSPRVPEQVLKDAERLDAVLAAIERTVMSLRSA